MLAQRCRLEAYGAELEAQAAAIRRAQESSRRCGAETQGLEAEASALAQHVREDRTAFEAATAKLAAVREVEEALSAEKRDLLRRIQTATLALGVKEALTAKSRDPACSDGPSLTEVDTMVTMDGICPGMPQLQRVKLLRQQLQVVGDENIELSEEAAVERERITRNRKTISTELDRLHRQREELNQALGGHQKTCAQMRESMASSAAEERKIKAETADLRSKVAAIKAEEGREGVDQSDLLQQLRGLALADVELREKLKEAQEQLWQQERWERGD